jgi:hypothetical protein
VADTAAGERGEDAERPGKPGIDELVRELGAAGSATFQAGREAGKALRILVSADISLARSAFGRTLAFTGVAIALGASAWLLLMATLVAWLALGLGWAWSAALMLPALLSLVAAAAAGWAAMRYFEHTRMKATRRQLARLGFGELAGLIPEAGSAQSAEQGAEQVNEATGGEPVKKGLGVDVTPP